MNNFFSKIFGPKKKTIVNIDEERLKTFTIRSKLKYLIQHDCDSRAREVFLQSILDEEFKFIEIENESTDKRYFKLDLEAWFFYEFVVSKQKVKGNFFELDWDHNGKRKKVIYDFEYDLKREEEVDFNNNELSENGEKIMENVKKKIIEFSKNNKPTMCQEVLEKFNQLSDIIKEVEKSNFELLSPEEKEFIKDTKIKAKSWINQLKQSLDGIEEKENKEKVLFNIEKRIILLNGLKELSTLIPKDDEFVI